MIEFRNDGDYVRFTISGYQYPDRKSITNEYDANWVLVAFDISLKGRRWERTDPCLLVWELRELAGWLEKLKGDNPNPVSKELHFTEPNLSFVLAGRNKKTATLRVVLGAELRLDENQEFEILECTVDQGALIELIKSIRDELAEYPQRDCEYF